MWKILLGFITHRLLLYGAALVVFQFAIQREQKASDLPFSQVPNLVSRITKKVAELPEVQAIRASGPTSPLSLITNGSSPFLVLGSLLGRFTGIEAAWVAILISNLFFLLCLWETHKLVLRIGSEETATLAGLLLVFFPTSYEWSLGSSFAADSFFVVWAVRAAIDDKWTACGLALLFGGLSYPPILALLPLIVAWFWFYSRHYQWLSLGKRALYLIVPVAMVLVLDGEALGRYEWFSHSAILSLFSGIKQNEVRWIFSQTMAAQTFTLILFGASAGIAVTASFSFLNRAVPVYLFLLWAIFCPYGSLASRATLAGACLQGIASISSKPLARLILALFFLAGVYEIYSVFV